MTHWTGLLRLPRALLRSQLRGRNILAKLTLRDFLAQSRKLLGNGQSSERAKAPLALAAEHQEAASSRRDLRDRLQHGRRVSAVVSRIADSGDGVGTTTNVVLGKSSAFSMNRSAARQPKGLAGGKLPCATIDGHKIQRRLVHVQDR